MIQLLLFLAAGCVPVEPLGLEDVSAQGFTPQESHTSPEEDTGTLQALLYMEGVEVWCSDGEEVEDVAQIPSGSLVQSFLLLDDGTGRLSWVDFQEGVVKMDRKGWASVNCVYPEDSFRVRGVRVTWISPSSSSR